MDVGGGYDAATLVVCSDVVLTTYATYNCRTWYHIVWLDAFGRRTGAFMVAWIFFRAGSSKGLRIVGKRWISTAGKVARDEANQPHVFVLMRNQPICQYVEQLLESNASKPGVPKPLTSRPWTPSCRLFLLMFFLLVVITIRAQPIVALQPSSSDKQGAYPAKEGKSSKNGPGKSLSFRMDTS